MGILDKSIKQVSAMAIVFVAVSYSFTLGYIEYLKIPETPEYLEATNFFIRAIFYAGRGTALLYVMLPICGFLTLIYTTDFIVECLGKHIPDCWKDNGKSFAMYLVFIFSTTMLAFCMYCLGKESLDSKEEAIFPMAILSERNSEENRIVWFGKKATYYLECNPNQLELRGVNDEEKIIFSRQIFGTAVSNFCK